MLLEKFKKDQNKEKRCICTAVDVYETQDNVTLKVDMPGVDRSTLNVSLQGDQLIISGDRADDSLNGKYTPLAKERLAGVQYYRAFEIGPQIDRDNINAQYQNGILNVTLAKAQSAQPKQIKITDG